jgi:alpha-D-ribose 1-methylphosphonate 5-triphosphate synthase subunit PhnH
VTVTAALTTFASQAAFRVLLDTLARPGRVGTIDVPDGLPAPVVVPLALADATQRVAVAAADSGRWEAVLESATGCVITSPEVADLVVALEGAATPELVAGLRRGSAEAPEDGGRLILGCTFLGAGCAVARRLSGPGIDGTIELAVDGLGHDVFDAIVEANRQFPAGIDVWLVAGDGAIAGLPRSTASQRTEARPSGT